MRKQDAIRPAFPIWLESIDIIAPAPDDSILKTVVRIRLRRLAGLSDELMLRLFFDDHPSLAPVVSAWTEIGECILPPETLGSGIGLPTSQTVLIPAGDADYIEIDVPGDGSSLRAALLTSLRKSETRHALDFAAAPPLINPFETLPHTTPATDDAYLYGRVKATLDQEPLRLFPDVQAAQTFAFDLEAAPLLAVLTFEVLNVEITTPPALVVNNRSVGSVAISLPDLADPGFQATVRSADRDVRFRYVGWLKCQKVVPGSYLQPGANSISLQTIDKAGAVAIRAVEVQLKYEPPF